MVVIAMWRETAPWNAIIQIKAKLGHKIGVDVNYITVVLLLY